MAGGSGPKLVRRIGTGLAVALYGISLALPLYLASIQIGALFAVTIIPYGDKIKLRLGWIYLFYLYFVGLVYGAALVPLSLHFHHWLRFCMGILICSLTFGTFAVGSQKIDFPKWKWVEGLIGFAVGFSAAWIMF